jgi:hypothetical protein
MSHVVSVTDWDGTLANKSIRMQFLIRHGLDGPLLDSTLEGLAVRAGKLRRRDVEEMTGEILGQRFTRNINQNSNFVGANLKRQSRKVIQSAFKKEKKD